MKRTFVLPSDVCKITKKKIRYAQSLLKKLKETLNKDKHQFITKDELAEHLGIRATDIELD